MQNKGVVGVIGTGIMGSGIAQVSALAKRSVVAVDVSPEALKRAEQSLCQSFTRMVEKGSLSGDQASAALDRVKFTTEYAALSGADMVIEAATEAIDLKRKILENVASLVTEETLIATNTSSISVTSLSTSTRNPAGFIGMHFFNPVRVMPLVELIRADGTSDTTCSRAEQFVRELGKTPIIVKNSPGFVVNRLLVPMINEAFFTLGEGIASAEEIDKAMKMGANHPLGPLELADMIGLDVCLAIMDVLFKDFGDSKYRAAPVLRELVAAGRLGKKSGRGVFAYT